MPKSTYLDNILLDLPLGAQAFSAPATVYVALFVVLPIPAGTGGTEATGGSYARVAVTNNLTNWPAASGGTKSNGTLIQFPTASAGWGTITGFGIYDAPTSGNLLYFGLLQTAKPVLTTDAPSFGVGTLSINES